MEIERKWIITSIPDDFKKVTAVEYVRDIIFTDENVELRIQKKNGRYELERKLVVDKLSRDTNKIEISEGEYKKLLRLSLGRVERIAYNMDEISIKEYLGKFKGLKRVEVEFENEEQAHSYQHPEWFGKEITGTQLANDSKLVKMSEEEFRNELNKFINY